MHYRLQFAALLLALLGASGTAHARNAEGALDFLLLPNNGVPALLAGGEEFSVEARGEATLELSGLGGNFPVEVQWAPAQGDRQRGACKAPAHLPAGLYSLTATHAGGKDTNTRAVAVLPPAEDYYVLAHLSDTHIGSARHKRKSTDILRDEIALINKSGAVFCLITGDLTDNGKPEEFKDFVEVLDAFTMPTFVCPGNHDRDGLNYEKTFGVLDYAFAYGRDGYLSFDTKDYVTAADTGPQAGALESLRRGIKAARWSIGFSHRYEPLQGMRSQLALFVDNPLDYLLFGHWHRENTEEEKGVPWGRTRISVVPAGINGAFRLIDVTPAGLRFRPVEPLIPVD